MARWQVDFGVFVGSRSREHMGSELTATCSCYSHCVSRASSQGGREREGEMEFVCVVTYVGMNLEERAD